jgi:hypothetical protein
MIMEMKARGKISGDCGGWSPRPKPKQKDREEEFIKRKEMELSTE